MIGRVLPSQKHWCGLSNSAGDVPKPAPADSEASNAALGGEVILAGASPPPLDDDLDNIPAPFDRRK